MFPRVAFEYGQVWCAPSTSACATCRSKPGRPTLRLAWRKYPSSPVQRSTSESMAMSDGSFTFIFAATIFIALVKQADQPTANNCSGLVPLPGHQERKTLRPAGHQRYG